MKSKVLELGGKTYDLKMNHRAIYLFNNEVEGGIIGFANGFTSGKRDFNAVYKMLWACINVIDKEVTFDKFMEMLDSAEVSFERLSELSAAVLENTFAKPEPGEKKEAKN